MGLLSEIHRKNIEGIKKRQEFIFEPRRHGDATTLINFFNYLYRDSIKEGKKYAFLGNFDGIKAKQFSCDSLEKIEKKHKKFVYYSPNTYYHPLEKVKDRLTRLNAIVLDLDFAKDGTNRQMTADEVAYLLFNEFDMYPHFVYESRTKGCYHALYLIDPMAASKDSIYLYEAISKRMSILVGSDFASTDATHYFGIPTGEIYKYENPINTYSIDDFRFVFDDEEINKSLKDKRNQYKKGSNVISFSEETLLRHPAIQKLMECDIVSHRNNACFTLALFFYSLNWSQERTEIFFEDQWYSKANSTQFDKRFTKKEMNKSIKSAYSGKYAGASAEWIEFVTGEEFDFQIYRSTYIKKDLYMSKNTLRSRFIEWLRKNGGKEVKQKELAGVLNVSYRSLQIQIKQMVEEGVIVVQSQKGRGKGTKFFLKENEFNVELKEIISEGEQKEKGLYWG